MPSDDELTAAIARKLFPKPLQVSCLQPSKILTAAAGGPGPRQGVPMNKIVVICENVGQYVDFVRAVGQGQLIPFPPFELQMLTALLDMLGALKEPEGGDGDA